MIALLICAVAFVGCYLAGRRSLGLGLVMLLAFGYFYGILRANLITTFSHFIFDAGLLGLYLSPSWRRVDPITGKRSAHIRFWTIILVLWPFLLVLLPFQPLLISLVGLRGNIYFIPLLLLGARLKGKDLTELSVGLAVLDLVAVAFATAEYFFGVTRFFPPSPVTMIIYSSADAGNGFFRIPATFSSAHAFGGTMVATLPYLVGLWTRNQKKFLRLLGFLTIPAALVGVLMSSTRSNFIFGCAIVLFVIFTTQMKMKYKAFFLVIIIGVTLAALTNVRFQRFKSLNDTDYVSERIAGSVNRTFWEILGQYPMGNGLGGGGTSIPYFLEGQVRNPIGMENEYARILSEQGVIGLLIWMCFAVWYFFKSRTAFAKGPWATTRRLLWCLTAIGLGTAWIGTGLLTAIPGTVLLMIGMGWTMVSEGPEAATVPERERLAARRYQQSFSPALQRTVGRAPRGMARQQAFKPE